MAIRRIGRRVRVSRHLLLIEWLAAITWAAVIFILSAQPDLRVASDDSVDFVVRKAGHMAAFGVLAVLLLLAFRGSHTQHPVSLAWLAAVLYAASDEFHQSFTIGRHASATDVVIDAVGISVGLAAVHLYEAGTRRLRSRPRVDSRDSIGPAN